MFQLRIVLLYYGHITMFILRHSSLSNRVLLLVQQIVIGRLEQIRSPSADMLSVEAEATSALSAAATASESSGYLAEAAKKGGISKHALIGESFSSKLPSISAD